MLWLPNFYTTEFVRRNNKNLQRNYRNLQRNFMDLQRNFRSLQRNYSNLLRNYNRNLPCEVLFYGDAQYILRYTVRNLVFQKKCFWPVNATIYLRKWKFWIWLSHSNAFLNVPLNLECCKPHKAKHHPTICDVINDGKWFPMVYCRIYCHKFLTLSNQTSHYKSKCIRIVLL